MRQFIGLMALFLCAHAGSLWAEPVSYAPGLVARYVDEVHVVETVVATPNFVLEQGESIHPQILPSFTAEWSGVIDITKQGKYTLSADGAEASIKVDKKEIAGKVTDLDLGKHAIAIRYVRKIDKARLRLTWSADFFQAEPVPASVLKSVQTAVPGLVSSSRAEQGRGLVEELNCVACHQSASKKLMPHMGPDLSAVGTRLQAAWIEKWLENPTGFRATTAMPHLPLKPEEYRDVAAYLVAQRNPANKVKEPFPSTSRLETGKQLVETIGCLACHSEKGGHSLEGIGSKWKTGQLAEYLINPQSVDHSGRMPSMLLQKDESLAIAEYLVHSKNPGYEGQAPRGDVKAGERLFQSQGCLNCHALNSAMPDDMRAGAAKIIDGLTLDQVGMLDNQMAKKMEAFAKANVELLRLKNSMGEQNPKTIEAKKDRDKALSAAEKCAAEYRGLQKKTMQSQWALRHISDAEKVIDSLTLDQIGMLDNPMNRKMGIYFGADAEFRRLQSTMGPKNPKTTEAKLVRDEALKSADTYAAGYRDLQKKLSSAQSQRQLVAGAIALEDVQSLDTGCLAEHPSGHAMDYGLKKEQVDLIGEFITSIKANPILSAAPAYEFYHKTKAFGCVNCHELDASMPSDTTERVPLLTNVGGKLRKEWIGEVLTQKRRVRPWLKRRMPEFGIANVGDMPTLAVAASGAGDAEMLPTPTRDEIAAGQKLLGNGAGGFGCITCHGFAGAKPNVIDDTRGPDITSVAGRLRPDHFRRWVMDPKRVSPSTPMPSFFDGAPAAEAALKVEAMLKYVAAGENMPPPVGWVDKNNYQIAVHDEPVVMRAFLPNPAGGSRIARGIAVGLPGLVSYCFDADTCTLRYAWTGGFLDMQPSWSGRGGNTVRVLGKMFYANNSFPFRVGDEKHVPEIEFKGYEMVDGEPVFSYTMDGVGVRETIRFQGGPEKSKPGEFNLHFTKPALLDTLEIEDSDKSIYLAAPADRDLHYGHAGIGDTLPRDKVANLGKKPGMVLFMMPLKESK